MPLGTPFRPTKSLLSPTEIGDICQVLHALGIEEIRVTGGEPTIRPGFGDIMTRLAVIPWRKFGITTNGFLLQSLLPLLKDVGCRHINVSLDSLDAERFQAITGSTSFQTVVDAILAAKAMGFEVKINTIVFRDLNDSELNAFTDFSARHGVEVRFLELMQVGPSADRHGDRFVPAEEMIKTLSLQTELIAVPSPEDSTSFGFRTAGGARLGFIASESKPFCGACSRLRLSATGKLRSCLFSDTGMELRGRDPLEFPELLHKVMGMKPTGRLPQILQPMNQIGG